MSVDADRRRGRGQWLWRGAATCLPAALVVAACVRSGPGTRSGKPIDASGEPRAVVTCQSVIGDEHARTEIVARTLDGLAPLAAGSQPGQESGVRGHPTEADVIVFARQTRANTPTTKELFVSSLDRRFTDVRLTRDGDTDCEPCWTTDGGSVLFASDRSGVFALWRVGRDGSGLMPVTQPVAGSEDREPDARAGRIVFARATTAGAGQMSAIWIMNADGSGMAPLTTGVTAGPSADGFVPGDHEPALAPDASSVLFVRRSAADRSRLMRLELGNNRLSEIAAPRDGEDRFPRFAPGDETLIVAHTAPADGLLGRRLVAMRLDGTDVVQLDLDQRLSCQGADFLAGAGMLARPSATALAVALEVDDARIVLGQRTLGRFADVRSKDGSGLQLVTEAFDGAEKAGVFVPFQLALPDPRTVARVRVRATFGLTVANPNSRVLISVKDYEQNRYDVAWNQGVPNTNMVDATFTFASLAHVDRDGWIRIELVAELPEGIRAELALDTVTVDAFERQP